MLVRLVAVSAVQHPLHHISWSSLSCHSPRQDGWIPGPEYPEVEVGVLGEKTDYWSDLKLVVCPQI